MPTAAARVPLVIDTDLGADDILAIAVTLADPAFDVRAITVAGTGLVHCQPGVPHLFMLLRRLGAPEMPMACGREEAAAPGVAFPKPWRAAADGAYGVFLPAASGRARATAADTIAAVARDAGPGGLTILALGPWTNLADALAAHPELAGEITTIHAMGGTIDRPGNVFRDDKLWAAQVEANFAADPAAVVAVLATGVPVRLVPLDATDEVPVPADIAETLGSDHRAAAADLAFELFARNPYLVGEGQYLWDETAAIALLDPGTARWSTEHVSISQSPDAPGKIQRASAGTAIRVASSADPSAVVDQLLARLRSGPAAAQPIVVTGSASITASDASCQATSTISGPGWVRFSFENHATSAAAAVLVAPSGDHTMAELEALARSYDPATDQVPAWVTLVAQLVAAPGGTSHAFAMVSAQPILPACGLGEPTAKVLIGVPIRIGR